MSRFKGPKNVVPAGESAWAMLNASLFGSNAVGGHSVAPRPEAVPVDWAGVFGREAPLSLEIGFNRGRFLRDLAAARPDEDHVGIEVRRRYVWHFTNRAGEDGGPRNVRVVWADARLVAPAVFGAGTLDAVFVNFPDPWWKTKHTKRRLLDEGFAQALGELLAPGGRIYVKSDVPMIANEIRDALATCLEGPTPFDEALLPMTYRESKCTRQGLPIDRYWFSRPE